MHSSSRRGFTLLELLVVVSIIGILIAMTAVSFTTAQQKSRDARRRADIKNLQNSLEQHYSLNNSAYPSNANCSVGGSYTWLPGQPNTFPTGPRGAGDTYSAACTTTTYCLCALMESGGGNSTTASCGFDPAGGNYYCLSNQQ